MKNEILISMENEMFKGNVLDIGFENYGIIYNVCKKDIEDLNVEYVSGKEDKHKLKKDFYDCCILFFALSEVWPEYKRNKLIEDIHNFLKKEGTIYIWDIDKKFGVIEECNLKIVLPDRKLKRIRVKNMNIFNDSSCQSTKKLLQKYFEVIDCNVSGQTYYVKAKKKETLKVKDDKKIKIVKWVKVLQNGKPKINF